MGGNAHYCTLSSAVLYDYSLEGMQFPGKIKGIRCVERLGRGRHLVAAIQNMLATTVGLLGSALRSKQGDSSICRLPRLL